MDKTFQICGLCGLLLFVSAHGLTEAVGQDAPAAEESQVEESQVTVTVTSGRKFTGVVDERTNDARLWLRSGDNSAFIRRPIEWDRVATVLAGGQQLSAAEFQDLVRSGKWVVPGNPFLDESAEAGEQMVRFQPAPAPEEIAPPEPAGVVTDHATVGPAVVVAEHIFSPRVEAVHIEAHLANWDSDVELDGLIVHASPLDGWGHVVPIRGSIEINLVGEEYRLQPGHDFPHLARWTRAVYPHEIGEHGAVFKLPFQAIHPDFYPEIGPLGLVHARLVVPGHGVFEDSADCVPVRTSGGLRELHLQLYGTRFFPHERTGRGIRRVSQPVYPPFMGH